MPEGKDNNTPTDAGGEARFRAIFENAAVGIARVGLDGRFMEVNQRLCEILGYAPEELMTKTFVDITHPDDLDEDVTAMKRISAGGLDTYVREKRYRRKDGSVVWANLTVAVVRKPEGVPDYCVSVVEDISTRKWAEERLHNEQQRLRLASELAGLGIFEWDVQADRAVWENQRMYEIFGHTHDDGSLSKAQLMGNYVHEDDVAGLNRALSDGAKSGRPIHTVYRIQRKDGAMRWLDLAGNFEMESDGTAKKMVGVMADITESRQAEETLRASEEQFRIMADTAPVMIWVSGIDMLCTFFNKSWLDFTGRGIEKELGNGWTEGVHREDYDRCLKTYFTSFEALKPFEMEYRLRRFDGEYRWLLDHGVPRFSASGEFLGYIGSCIDLTERKQAEAEREQLAQEQLARAAAEAASRSKDEFLAMVSHELRSPLNAILGYAQILRSSPMGTEYTDKAVDVIERNARAQSQIIEDLFDSARIITGKLAISEAAVDLVPVLDAALDTVRAVAEAKRIALVPDFDRRPEYVLGDSMRLQQVVWNLLSNSVKFTPDGGRVELRMESDADYVRLTVCDNGKGIEREFLPNVFDRFRQADVSSSRRYGGLGLGLSLVKHLVELHGGTVGASSEGTGRGSTFIVTLPRRHPESSKPGFRKAG
jgi:PAS domain S-box-containing protein